MTGGRSVDRNSMTLWWPRTKNLPVPQPRTVVVDAERRVLSSMMERENLSAEDEAYMADFYQRIHLSGDGIGYPLFMRTDLASGKHGWRNTCFVDARPNLTRNLAYLIEANEMAGMIGLDYCAIFLREYIPLASRFTAFDGMPVAPERRYFVEGGKVLCHHPYWPQEAIERSFSKGLPSDWPRQLAEMNREGDEVSILTVYAEEISKALDGRWSVDFALGRDALWRFIDAATMQDSWHPDCPIFGRGNDHDEGLSPDEIDALMELRTTNEGEGGCS